MQGLLRSGGVECCGVADHDRGAARAAAALAPYALAGSSLDDLLALSPDGIAIATPSALHAEQAIRALEAGVAVFCQKPLARDAGETSSLLEAARRADRLLAVDLSYRHTTAMGAVAEAVRTGQLGDIYAIELVFHNAYGPDKPWFMRRSTAGGGCLLDLGTHLLDLALWLTGAAGASVEAATLLRRGAALAPGGEEVEDFAVAQLRTDSGVTIRLACSWWLPVGRECAVECTLYGTRGSASMGNVGGSFYDFRAELRTGTATQTLVEPPDDWGPRAITVWAQQLARGERFDDRGAEELQRLADTLDAIYARSAQ
jgi:predicted dehydrogenase